MEMEELKDSVDSQTDTECVTPNLVHVLLQDSDKPLEGMEDDLAANPTEDMLPTDGLQQSLPVPAEIKIEPSAGQLTSVAGLEPISNMAGVDIVTLQPTQLQSVFQVMGGDGGSYILSDGQLLQATPSGETQSLQSVTLPNGMAALIQADSRDESVDAGQPVQLEDGTTVVQNLQELKDTISSKLLQNQVIQLEDGTTGFLQAGFPGGEGVQSVQLEDGSTAYISLFGDATSAAGLRVDPGQQAQAVLQAVQPVTIEPDPTLPSTSVESGNSASVKVETMETQNSLADPALVIATSAMTEVQPSPAKVTISQQDISQSAGDKLDVIPQRHVSERAIALGDKAYKCLYEGCGRLYTTQHHLKVHERSHTGDKPFRCEYVGCNKAFPTGYGLKSHTRVHTGEKPYRCSAPECLKAFKTSGDLQKHLRTHTGERPFQCPFEGCDRSFTTSNIRKVHIRTHTGERPYICREDGCNKSFASATNYKNHIRIHTGEKPYVCAVDGCGKRFTEYSSLYKHHVVHTQSKPYICNHCQKTYRQTSTLAMHKRTVHNDHDMCLETENSLIAAGRIRLLEHCDVGAMAERDPDLSDSDGTLVINTSEMGGGGPGGGGEARMLTTLQTVPHGSPALLQHLQPSALSVDGLSQVYLITDPSQLQGLKTLSNSPTVVEPHSSTDAKNEESSQDDTDDKTSLDEIKMEGVITAETDNTAKE